MTFNERMLRVRRHYTRIIQLLEGSERGPLVTAAIVHAAAHLADDMPAVDTKLQQLHLVSAVHEDAEHTTPAQA